MPGVKTSAKKALPEVVIDESLAQYKNKELFSNKIEEANKILRSYGVPGSKKTSLAGRQRSFRTEERTVPGRRKEAVARVFLSKGNGRILINEKLYKFYFPLVYLQNKVELPLKVIGGSNKFDVQVHVTGGGMKDQAAVTSLGIARSLVAFNPEYRGALKAAGLLMRQPMSAIKKRQAMIKGAATAKGFRKSLK
ncbi:MAG: 30S ribosomal protein S9 [Dinghuibacter sp.]|nr:30S ribosomal protein S9 [Dinghuibacter sp.]